MRNLLMTFGVATFILVNVAWGNDDRQRGATLYAELCAACHGPLDATNKPNRPFGRIASAIRIVPSMYHLKHLTREDLEALAAALAQPQGAGK